MQINWFILNLFCFAFLVVFCIDKYRYLLNLAIECRESGKPFGLIQQELNFYKKNNLPIPILHPDVRHQNRTKKRNPQHLRNRTCANCNTSIKSSYSPDRPEIVYCETCYDKTFYS